MGGTLGFDTIEELLSGVYLDSFAHRQTNVANIPRGEFIGES